MNHDLREQVSAAMDGELEKESARFLIRRLQTDTELADCWERYHVVGACIRRQVIVPLRSDFAAGISAALVDEALPSRARGGTMLRWAGGAAVAASVTLVALLALPPQQPASPQPTFAAATESRVAPLALRESDLRPDLARATQTVAASQGQALGPVLQVDPRIESYLIRHNHILGDDGHGIAFPYIQLVTPPEQPGVVPMARPASQTR